MIRVGLGNSLVFAAVACGATPTHRYRDIIALDDGSALLIWDVSEDRSRVGRMGVDGTNVWESRPIGYPAYGIIAPNFSVHGNVVGIREFRERRTELAVEALDLETGRHVWDVLLYGVDAQGHGFSLQTRNAMFEVIGKAIVALDPANGRVRSRAALDSILSGEVIGDRVAFDANGEVNVIDDAGHSSAPQNGRGCSHEGDLITFRNEVTAKLVVAPRADLSRAHVVDVELDRGRVIFDYCFGYRDLIGLVRSSDSEDTTVISFVDRFGKSKGQFAIAGQPVRWKGAHPPASRFFPFVTRSRDTNAYRLMMLDLERLELVWTRDIDAERNVFRNGRNWYVVTRDSHHPTILSFDGDTGDLRGAVRVLANVAEIRPDHVRGGSFWLMAYDGWSSHARVARLDATTLIATLESNELPIQNIWGEIRTDLKRSK